MPAPSLTFRPLSAEMMMRGDNDGAAGASVGWTVVVVVAVVVSGTSGNRGGDVAEGSVTGCMVFAMVTTLGILDGTWLGISSYDGGCPK